GTKGFAVDGRISGRFNKDDGVFQFYKKISQSFDYNAIFGAIFPEGTEGSGGETGFEFPAGVVTIDIESTIDGNTKDGTISAKQFLKHNQTGSKKIEENFSTEIELGESSKGGDRPEYTQ